MDHVFFIIFLRFVESFGPDRVRHTALRLRLYCDFVRDRRSILSGALNRIELSVFCGRALFIRQNVISCVDQPLGLLNSAASIDLCGKACDYHATVLYSQCLFCRARVLPPLDFLLRRLGSGKHK
jgi:hypothetical protein